ncbi:MAG: NAD(P)/FAD-dependent oxidoreductase [Clostridia bacterium]|nr:NAD(P)/FAD-dependent oxidoreductase [Clostridia bacterium]
MNNTKHILVVGGGAAGLIAAGFAARRGLSVTILERNDNVARKVMITGKGRCNLTNNCTVEEFMENVPKNPRFLYSSINGFTPHDTMRLIESLGVPLKTERGRRVFPQSDKAADIVDALRRFALKSGAKILKGRAVSLTIENGELKGVATENGGCIKADAVIVSTGGKSYPLTGSTGDGYVMARQAGHTITELSPSLVPIVTSDADIRQAQGLSLKNVTVTVKCGDKTIFSELGEMLFTHFGVSGPLILSASSHMRDIGKKQYAISIDLKPGLDMQQLDARILRDFEKYRNSFLQNSLGDLLPKSIIPVIIGRSKVAGDTVINQITKKQRQDIADAIKNLTLSVTGFRPIEEAIITSGGVSVREIDPKTMQSKKLPGLYFAGEVIDVDAYTGGYNLQIAFATGAAAGKNV